MMEANETAIGETSGKATVEGGYVCPICNKSFQSERALSGHIGGKHPRANGPRARSPMNGERTPVEEVEVDPAMKLFQEMFRTVTNEVDRMDDQSTILRDDINSLRLKVAKLERLVNGCSTEIETLFHMYADVSRARRNGRTKDDLPMGAVTEKRFQEA